MSLQYDVCVALCRRHTAVLRYCCTHGIFLLQQLGEGVNEATFETVLGLVDVDNSLPTVAGRVFMYIACSAYPRTPIVAEPMARGRFPKVLFQTHDYGHVSCIYLVH